MTLNDFFIQPPADKSLRSVIKSKWGPRIDLNREDTPTTFNNQAALNVDPNTQFNGEQQSEISNNILR